MKAKNADGFLGDAHDATHILSPSNTQKSKETSNDSEQKMLTALYDGDAIVAIAVNFCKGTWIQNGDDSYIEEHPTFSFGFRLKSTTVKLDGMEIVATSSVWIRIRHYLQFEGTQGRNRFIYGKTFGRK